MPSDAIVTIVVMELVDSEYLASCFNCESRLQVPMLSEHESKLGN